MERLRKVRLGDHGEQLVGESPVFLDTLRQIARVVRHPDTRILILGESGTGKELVARAIHKLGPCADRPWIPVNIGETPSTLVESSLFGHEKGAFTDARELRRGLLELAGNGTLFLDEIGDLELPLQSKLLRTIQEREFRRLGGNIPLQFEARLICATNLELATAVQRGAFRQDLYHRIAEVIIQVPPLRERRGDIDRLVDHFVRAYSREDRSLRFARETLTILRSYPFPGNIRELQNLVKGAMIQSEGEVVLPRHLPLANMGKFLQNTGRGDTPDQETEAWGEPALFEFSSALKGSLPENWMGLPYREAVQALAKVFDRVYLLRRLENAHYNITRAAASAGLDTKTFRKHWKECGLVPLGEEERAD